MGAEHIEIRTQVSASKKLGADDAAGLLKGADQLIVAKGKKRTDVDLGTTSAQDAAAAMLGPTGNLRAPTLIVGTTVVVGFNEEAYEALLGA